MENYKIDTLRIFPGVVKEKLVRPVQDKKGMARAKKAYGIMMAPNPILDKATGDFRNETALETKTPQEIAQEEAVSVRNHLTKDKDDVLPAKLGEADVADAAVGSSEPEFEKDEAGEWTEVFDKDQAIQWRFDFNENLPKPVPHPDQKVILKNTNLYEALKYVRPGHFLIPSEALPARFNELPNGRIPSFDIVPVKQEKLTIVNIARFNLSHTHPIKHTMHTLCTMWTHFLKSTHVTCQLAFRPKAHPNGYTFEWIYENCVHLRPDIIQRSLPSTTRIALEPITNGNEITWLVVPRKNPVDYMARWKARQKEQKQLLKEGRGMLPDKERTVVKKELKRQLKAGKMNPSVFHNFSPMAMSVARLGIHRRIDDLLFKYEKLYNNIRSYVGTRYGAGRRMDIGERRLVNKLVSMEKVDSLKYTPKPYIPRRHPKSAQLDAASKDRGPWLFKAKDGVMNKDAIRNIKREQAFIERSGQFEPAVIDLGHGQLNSNFNPKNGGTRPKVGKQERTFVKQFACAEIERDNSMRYEAKREIRRVHWQLDSQTEAGRPNREQAHKEQFATPKHVAERNKTTEYEKERDHVTTEDRIEKLKKEAQKDWDEDDPMNSLSSHTFVIPNEPPAASKRSPDVLKHEVNPRTGLLPFMSKFEIADRVELPIRKHNSDKAPSPIRMDDQVSKSKSTRYPIRNSSHKAKLANYRPDYRATITPRNEYGSPDKEYRREPRDRYGWPDKEYRRGPRDDNVSELPREPQMDRCGGQTSGSRSDAFPEGKYAQANSRPRHGQLGFEPRDERPKPYPKDESNFIPASGQLLPGSRNERTSSKSQDPQSGFKKEASQPVWSLTGNKETKTLPTRPATPTSSSATSTAYSQTWAPCGNGHKDTSESISKIKPFLPIEGIGSEIIEKQQYEPNAKRPGSRSNSGSRSHSEQRKRSKGAPNKKAPRKKVVDEFAFHQNGIKKGTNSAKHMMLKAFKMDFAVAGNK